MAQKTVLRACVLALAFAAMAPTSVEASELDEPRVFLNCASECFEPYLRQELSAFDLVRDRHQARYEVLIAAQPSGGGGISYSVTLFARDEPSSVQLPAGPRPRGRPELSSGATTRAAVRKVTRRPGQALVEFRAQLLDAILRVLYGAVLGTPYEARFRLTLPARSHAALERIVDRWDYWVIMPELSAEGEGGSGYHFVEVGSGVTLRRITDRHKVRLRANYWRSLSAFEFEDGSEISGDVYGFEGTALYARSLGEHYAVGLTATLRASEFENYDLHVHYGPVIEANLFPYTQNAARQLRFVYQLGVWYNDYIEQSASGVASELRYYHAVSAIADVNQSWGSVQVATQLNSFLREPSRFRLALGGQLTLLLFEGLSVELEGTSAWVRDQINVRQRPLGDTEVLLFTAEQPTRFVLEATLGFSYAFGSVHNTIVNPRFGRVDLNEE
jgi:hypothetical protein